MRPHQDLDGTIERNAGDAAIGLSRTLELDRESRQLPLSATGAEAAGHERQAAEAVVGPRRQLPVAKVKDRMLHREDPRVLVRGDRRPSSLDSSSIVAIERSHRASLLVPSPSVSLITSTNECALTKYPSANSRLA